jgi:hypothetical protein
LLGYFAKFTVHVSQVHFAKLVGLWQETPRRGREASTPSFNKEIQEVQGGQEVPHDGGAIIPKDA